MIKKELFYMSIMPTSVKVIDFSNYEIYGTGIGETQN